jgi:hypothetical protein
MDLVGDIDYDSWGALLEKLDQGAVRLLHLRYRRRSRCGLWLVLTCGGLSHLG